MDERISKRDLVGMVINSRTDLREANRMIKVLKGDLLAEDIIRARSEEKHDRLRNRGDDRRSRR